MKMEDIQEQLEQMLSPKRYRHSLKVMEASVALAQKYGEDTEKAAMAGLVHDCAKDLKKDAVLPLCDKYGIIVDKIMRCQPELLHGAVGARLARERFGITDQQILSAIADHTMGKAGMAKLSSIVFVADYIEAGRTYPGVEIIRKAADVSLEMAIVAGIDNTIEHILKKGSLLHPQTVETRNWALEQMRIKI